MKVYAFDTEDLGQGYTSVTQCGFYDGDRFHIFTGDGCRESALAFIRKHPGKYYTFNLEYDLINLFWPDLDELTFYRTGSRIIYANYGRSHFYDLVFIGLVGMRKAASLIGREKTQLDARSEAYLKNDLVNTYEWYVAIESAVRGIGGRMKSTLAGIALSIFENQNGRLSLPDFGPADWDLIRGSYYGGRTEVFEYGKARDVSIYDVNSLYPYVMREYVYPDLRVWRREVIPSCRLYVSRVNVRAPGLWVPLLPYRSEGRLLFPTGEFSGVYTSVELEAAKRAGYYIEYLSTISFPAETRPFTNYIDDLYAKRIATKNEFEKFFLKICMNSLYGKFATHSGIEKYTGFICDPKIEVLEDTADYANVVWSSFITSYARLHLWNLLRLFKSGDLIYTDTDSVIIRRKVENILINEIDNTRLGALKLEARSRIVEIRGLKYYRYKNGSDWVYKIRGVPLDQRETFFLFGEANYKKPLKLLESIRRHTVPNLWADMIKSDFGGNPKRVILANSRTQPIEVATWPR